MRPASASCVLGVADDEAGDFFEAYGGVDAPSVTVVRRG